MKRDNCKALGLVLVLTTTMALMTSSVFAGQQSGEHFQPGQKASVARSTNIMRGDQNLGEAHRGMSFDVKKVDGSWIGGSFDVNGKQVGGWVWAGHLRHSDATASRPQNERRSFSYEPDASQPTTASRPTYRSMPQAMARQPWQLQKTDPRRYP